VDARLLAHPSYGALPARAELIARIATLTTVSAPFRGTPLARRVGRGAWLAAPALWFGSILASRHRLRLAGQIGTLLTLAKRALLQDRTPTDELIAQLADVDDDTAHQIRRFLADVASDHRLVEDLTPEAMAELNRPLEGRDVVAARSFVSVAPPARLSPRAFLTAPLQRVLYDLTWSLTAAPPPPEARLPEGPFIGKPHLAIGLTSNDGIVPAWSQTLDGRTAGFVLGDHLDVIGHSEAAGATFLSSGSRFDEARFRALWSAVSLALQQPAGGVSSTA
jgi:hypothetical protein